MKTCELLEVEVSSLVDAEVDPQAVPALVDHLLVCPSCREFYRQARSLDLELAETRGELPIAEALPEGWNRIERELGGDWRQAANRRWAPRVPGVAVWALRMAAVLALLVGGWSLARLWPAAGPAADGTLEVQLASDRGAMSDQRFLEITMELLRADPRYHQKMQEIMTAVSGWGVAAEGSGERPRLQPPRGDGELRLATDRQAPSRWY